MDDKNNSYVIISKIKSGNIPIKPIPLNTVTIRERDSMNQERIKVDLIENFLFKSFDISNWLQ